MRILELGGGTNRHPKAFASLDKHHPFNSLTTDIGVHDWPVDTQMVDLVYSSHVLEHIPKGDATIHVFNEAMRVLKPGGRFVSIFPIIGYTDPISMVGRLVSAWEPYADPTHVQGWWLPESVGYFTGRIHADADYGIHPGWADLGVHLSEENMQTELWGVRSTGYPVDHRSWWGIAGGWEGAFSLCKEGGDAS